MTRGARLAKDNRKPRMDGKPEWWGRLSLELKKQLPEMRCCECGCTDMAKLVEPYSEDTDTGEEKLVLVCNECYEYLMAVA